MNGENPVRIDNLADYLAKVKELGLAGYISRGECRRHGGIQASAFRLYEGQGRIFTNKDLGEYYGYIGNGLSPMQQQHFLAFAQHHGLPTNLIDFTTSPLVSLFFACYGGAKSEAGYVYCIDKNKLISVDAVLEDRNTDLMSLLRQGAHTELYTDFFETLAKTDGCGNDEGMALFARFGEALLRLAACLDEDRLTPETYSYLSKIQDDLQGHPSQFHPYMAHLLEKLQDVVECYLYGNDIQEALHSEVFELYPVCNYDFGDHRFLDSRRKNYLDREQDEYKYGYDPDTFPDEKTIIGWKETLRNLIMVALDFCLLSTEPYMEIPLYFTYSPPNIAHRVNMQNSIFIYQLYRHGSVCGLEGDEEKLLTQWISPDITIEVNNREAILRELDLIGINLKSIFGDYESIARYIKEKA